MMDIPDVDGYFKRSIEEWHNPVYLILYFQLRTLQIAFFVHNITHESGIQVTIVVCGWYQAVSSK